MQRNYLSFCTKLVAFTLLIMVTTLNVFSQGKKLPLEKMYNGDAQGREFWVVIPPNDGPASGVVTMAVYVTSAFNTQVTMEVPGVGKKVTKNVKAFEVIEFSARSGDIDGSYELWQPTEVPVQNKAIKFSAPQPISVYVINNKSLTSDGYLALPTSTWGRNYINIAYWDWQATGVQFPWASGFAFVAKDDGTVVDVTLKGPSSGLGCTTIGGKRLGQSFRVTLNAGECYTIRGYCGSSGIFDMSGSSIRSNKPIGFLSYHVRTVMPQASGGSQDHMVEMLPPVQAWGKKYYTVEMQRNGRGDFFRVMASEPNTTWSVKWYDKSTKQPIGNYDGFIANAGEFWDYVEGAVGSSSIRGTSVWTADKPFFVMQYAYSANWDGASIFDPFMVNVIAAEQYTKGTVFQTPSGYTLNYFNILVDAASEPDLVKRSKLLETVKVDGQFIYITNPAFKSANIPGTDIYWASIVMSAGSHTVESELPFGGYVYGFSTFDSYGWPAATAVRKIDELDTLPPVLLKQVECGDYKIRATEKRNGAPGDSARQVDQGVKEIFILENNNYQLFDPPIDINELIDSYDYELRVVDKTQNAFCKYLIRDRADNFTLDSVAYEAQVLTFNPTPLVFNQLRIGRTRDIDVTITNPGDSSILIKEIKLFSGGEGFSIFAGQIPPELTLAPQATHTFTVRYTPFREALLPTDIDKDTVEVETSCALFKVPVTGRGVVPKIIIEDWNAGDVVVGSSVCKLAQPPFRGLRIQNPGTDTLTIFRFSNVNAPFTLSDPTIPALPIKIAPKSQVDVNALCYFPTQVGPSTLDVVVEHDGVEGSDSISLWQGNGITPGPTITSYDWDERRVLTEHTGDIFVRNSGTSQIILSRGEILPANPNFEIIASDPPTVLLGNPFTLLPNNANEVKFTVRYTPQVEATHTNPIVATFNDNTTVQGSLRGVGILPKITALGHDFGSLLVGTTSPIYPSAVTITNPSTTADLFIESISKNPASPQFSEFNFETPNLTNITIPKGGTIVLPMTFGPTAVGLRTVTVDIVSDAETGPNVNPRVTTSVDVIGRGFTTDSPSLTVNDINYGVVSTCDQPVRNFRISNTGNLPITVTNLQLNSTNPNVFTLITPTPINIAPNQFADVDVRFAPPTPGNYAATVRVITDFDSSQFSTLLGIGAEYTSQYALQNDISINPGTPTNMTISGTSAQWAESGITSFTAEVEYDIRWMKYNNKIQPGASLPAGWTVTGSEVRVDATTMKAVLTANGPTPISQNGVLLLPEFFILIADTIEFTPRLNVTINNRVCAIPSSTPGKVELIGCFMDGRLVDVGSGVPFALASVSPNPIDGAEGTVEFGIGFDAYTDIQILDMSGNVVRSVITDYKKPGVHSAKFTTSDLPSGTYYCKMSAGPYTETRSFIINK